MSTSISSFPKRATPPFLSARLLRFLGGILCWILAVAATGNAAAAGDAPLKVFVLAGQSNMVGHAASAGLPPDLLEGQPAVLLYRKGAWVPLKPGRTFGPEVTFGQAMAQHFGQPIGIIKVAVDSTNLAVQWSPTDPHSLYGRLLGQVQEAQKSRPIVIEGMVWVQGGRDARDATMAAAYQKNLAQLIESARRDFGNPSLLFVCGRATSPFPYTDLVRKAQESIDLPGYRMVNADDLSKNSDKLHYDTAGQQELGKRCAAAMIALLPGAKKAP